MVSLVTRISNVDCVNVTQTVLLYIWRGSSTWHKVDIKLLDLGFIPPSVEFVGKLIIRLETNESLELAA